jgi:hypothetical protein
VRRIADATLAPDAAAETVRLGSFVLSFYLRGAVSIDGAPLKLDGEYWDGVRNALKARSPTPAAQGLILLAQPPAP